MVRNPTGNAAQGRARDNSNRTNNIASKRNTANNSARRNQYRVSIYKKDDERQQINNRSVQDQRVKNTVHTPKTVPNAYRQNVQNISGRSAHYNQSNPNVNASGRMRTGGNNVSGRRAVASIYSKTYVLDRERLRRQVNYGDSKSVRRHMTGAHITTKIRKAKERIADGRLYVADVLKQLFLFKALDQSKVVTEEREKKAIPVKTIFAITICIAFIMTWIFSGMKLYENAIIIADTESEIVKLQKQIQNNEIILEAKNDLSYIESVAVNELGMIKKELLPTQYILIGRTDEVILTNAQNTDYISFTFDMLKDIFGRLK